MELCAKILGLHARSFSELCGSFPHRVIHFLVPKYRNRKQKNDRLLQLICASAMFSMNKVRYKYRLIEQHFKSSTINRFAVRMTYNSPEIYFAGNVLCSVAMNCLRS